MAFANKIGNLFKNAVNSTPSIYQSIRCMSSSKLFVGGVSYSTDDQSLREAFTGYGEVVEARVIMDRETGRSRGFGFVTFTSSDEASAAMSAMDGKELHGRVVRVNYATDRSSGGGFRGGYGGGGGGYGGGGYGGYGGGGGGYGGYGGGGYGGGGSYGGGGYGGGGSNYGGGYGDGSSAGGNYGGGNYNGGGAGGSSNYGAGGYGGGSSEGNYGVTDRSSANYASSDPAVPGFSSGPGAFEGSVAGEAFGSSTTGGSGHDKEDADYEPDDYANKRS